MKCVGLKLLSWDYPENGSLKELIGMHGLYPITCLHTLRSNKKQKLFENEIVLCKQLCKGSGILKKIDVKQNRE